MLGYLTSEESWKLIKLTVFDNPNCPRELEELGRVIVDMCRGLPLVIMLVAGVLARTASTGDMKVMQSSWKKVTESLKPFIYNDSETILSKLFHSVTMRCRLT
ncbi:hypothetical protein Sango_1639700 [Sesamum angolense]|uniref:NB-ARC domain-containing protein n=1 Tax=Sesamum angolense TaxID=2727404 RepID=A0AAE1WK79_9LAMI|nr:hypothetical protein Sango_1639700 [Sesamum angolense]